MDRTFLARAEWNELRALARLAGLAAGKLARLILALAGARIRLAWIELRENAERGARGWR